MVHDVWLIMVFLFSHGCFCRVNYGVLFHPVVYYGTPYGVISGLSMVFYAAPYGEGVVNYYGLS